METRSELKPYAGLCKWFEGTFERHTVITSKDFARVLFLDIEFNGNKVADHAWVTVTYWSGRRRTKLLTKGKRYRFKGKIDEYTTLGGNKKYGITYEGRLRVVE